jgi:hypothetical protein
MTFYAKYPSQSSNFKSMPFARHRLSHPQALLICSRWYYHTKVTSLHNNYCRIRIWIKEMDNLIHFVNIPSLKDWPIAVKVPAPLVMYCQDMDCMMVFQNLIVILAQVVWNRKHFLQLLMSREEFQILSFYYYSFNFPISFKHIY